MDVKSMIKKYGWDAIVNRMNDTIREELHELMAPCSEEEFLNEYIKRHEFHFDEIFNERIFG